MLTELAEARRLTADLRVQFNRASDASDRAVMADTDEASIAFARESERAKELVKVDLASLETRLARLNYPAEITSLHDFTRILADYEKLDHIILELAVENTNLKAQRLSFGPAREAADAFKDSLASLSVREPNNRCRADLLIAKALLAVREIQVLQAPHIAEAQDSVMTELEAKMNALQKDARDVLTALPGLVGPKAASRLTVAATSLDRFQGISEQIVKLSRRNSNVLSVDLSLRQKPTVAASADESLRALQDALAKEGFTATR